MANTYDINDAVRISVSFTSNGSALDPTAVSLKIQDPSGNEATYTYAAGQIVRSSTGVYYKDLTIDEGGNWYYRWEGSGVLTGAYENYFFVRFSEF